MRFADRYFLSADEESVFADIADFVDVDDIRAVNLHETLFAHLFFQVFYSVMGDVFFSPVTNFT